MPAGILSSVVFVANQGGTMLRADMFDERDLCVEFGPLGGNQIKAGPVGQFQYSGGIYEFLVAPDRVDIRCHEADILPPSLLQAARKIARILERTKSAIPTSGIGINCDTIFQPDEIGHINGVQWCQLLTDTQHSHKVLGSAVSPFVTFTFQVQSVRYTVRFEPDAQTRGNNLIVAVNGHQDVTTTDQLEEKLSAVEEVKEQAVALHQRLPVQEGE